MSDDTISVYPTFEVFDKQTCGNIIYQVLKVHKYSKPDRFGWTHDFVLRRPRGRKIYLMACVMEGDEVMKHSRPKVFM